MDKRIRLISGCHLPSFMEDCSTRQKYKYLQAVYDAGGRHILLNNVRVFGPFPKSSVPWDISVAQKIATYDPEVKKVIDWVNTKIVINLASMDIETVLVLIRIATGMLNKCNIPKCMQIMFHDNMTENLRAEHALIVTSELPF